MPDHFDVFLSYNSQDLSVVRRITDALTRRGLRVWFDQTELKPGSRWQEALEEVIRTTRSAAVMVGENGLGPWEKTEMRAILSRFAQHEFGVVPVLLPGAPRRPELPLFLSEFSWIDLRGGLNDHELDRLVWGITGEKPLKLERSFGVSEIPRPLEAFLDGPCELPMVPFEVGTAWGLDRGSFVGVFAGGRGGELLDSLRHAEKLVQSRVGATPSRPRLATRQWLSVHPHISSLPRSLKELAIVTRSSAQLLEDAPENGAFGLVVELTLNRDQAWHPRGFEWCAALAREDSPFPISAVAVEIGGDDATTAIAVARKLRDRLAQLKMAVPVELAISAREDRRLRPDPAAGDLGALLGSSGDPLGRHVAVWSLAALAECGESARSLLEEHRELHRLLDEFNQRHPDARPQKQDSSSAEQLVAELEELLDRRPDQGRAIEEVLQLVEQYLPDRVPSLMAACGQSNSDHVARIALGLAARSGPMVDRHVDAWMTGRGLGPDTFPRAAALTAVAEASVIEPVALALLRRYPTATAQADLEALLAQLSRRWAPELETIYELKRQDLAADEFLAQASARAIGLALRADVHPRLGVSLPNGLSAPALWWAATIEPPGALEIDALLDHNVLERGIFGLITDAEQEALRLFPEDLETVQRCRRNRPMFGPVIPRSGAA